MMKKIIKMMKKKKKKLKKLKVEILPNQMKDL